MGLVVSTAPSLVYDGKPVTLADLREFIESAALWPGETKVKAVVSWTGFVKSLTLQPEHP
jgi:hypothetical protein